MKFSYKLLVGDVGFVKIEEHIGFVTIWCPRCKIITTINRYIDLSYRLIQQQIDQRGFVLVRHHCDTAGRVIDVRIEP